MVRRKIGCILPPKKRTSELSSLAATLRHMSDFVLQGAILERCVREDSQPGFFTQRSAPGLSPTDSRSTPLGTKLITGEQFDTLLQQRLERRGGWRKAVCSPGSSNQPMPCYHIIALTILWSILIAASPNFAT